MERVVTFIRELLMQFQIVLCYGYIYNMILIMQF
jgi:hypothetical protein